MRGRDFAPALRRAIDLNCCLFHAHKLGHPCAPFAARLETGQLTGVRFDHLHQFIVGQIEIDGYPHRLVHIPRCVDE